MHDAVSILLENNRINSYLNGEITALMLLDWSKGASYRVNYEQSASNTQVVGRILANYIKKGLFILDFEHCLAYTISRNFLHLSCVE